MFVRHIYRHLPLPGRPATVNCVSQQRLFLFSTTLTTAAVLVTVPNDAAGDTNTQQSQSSNKSPPITTHPAASTTTNNSTTIITTTPSSTLQLIFRSVQLTLLFGPPLLFVPFAFVFSSCRELLQDWFVWSLSAAGPTFIKLGQWLSTRPDIFPIDFCLKLSHFHDSVPTLPFSSAERTAIVQAASTRTRTRTPTLSATAPATATPRTTTTTTSPTTHHASITPTLHLTDIYEEFDPIPIGSGCVSQVYLARLRTSSATASASASASAQRVVIKVKRHGVDQQICDDLELLQRATSWIEYLLPSLRFMSLSGCVNEFSDLLLSQLDLLKEGQNLVQFTKNFQRTWNKKQNECISFPTPLLEMSSKDVLVETYEEGVSLSQWLQERELFSSSSHSRTERQQKVEAKIADIGARSFFEMVLVHNFIHSDLHPGNILIARKKKTTTEQKASLFSLFSFFGEKNASKSEHSTTTSNNNDRVEEGEEDEIRLIYLDVGLTTVLRKQSRNNFIALFSAVASGQGRHAAELMVERSHDPSTCVDMEGFVNGMTVVIESAVKQSDKGFNLGDVRIGEVLMSVMTLCQKHHVKVDDTMAQLVSSIALLDGIGRQLAPERDLFDTALPVLSRLWNLHPDYRKAIGKTSRNILFGKTST